MQIQDTRRVIAEEVLDRRCVLEACVGHRLNICQPCGSCTRTESEAWVSQAGLSPLISEYAQGEMVM